MQKKPDKIKEDILNDKNGKKGMWDSIKRYLLINILMYNYRSIGSLICGNCRWETFK